MNPGWHFLLGVLTGVVVVGFLFVIGVVHL